MEDHSYQSTPTPPPYNVEPARKKRPTKALVICLIVIVVLGIGAALAWYFLSHDTKTMPQVSISHEKSAAPSSPQPALTKNQLIDGTKEAVEQHVATTYPAMKLMRQTAEGPGYRVAGTDFYTIVQNNPQLTVLTNTTTDDAASLAAVKAASEYLTSKGLTQTTSIALASYSVTDFQSSDAVCSITTQQSTAVDVRCGDKKDYTQTASQLKALVELVRSAPIPYGAYGDELAMSIEQEKASQTPGYQLVQIAVSLHSNPLGGGTNVFAYKKDAGNWTYFTASEEIMLCKAYTTTELRAAYKGESCVDAKGNTTTVQ